ncbi:MxaL protein [Ramlibacter sp.]|uniref:MxaL protein n=1 Tax=Ramlibacter sp. TaxID=1917967 RepID=UPI00262B1284|nr:MxaL protein [Ramlibacter sp.]MDB5955980.1 MxaL protein [Ramlibacter sp.]
MTRWRRWWSAGRAALPDASLLVAAILLLVLALVLPPLPLSLPRPEAVVVFDITQSMDVEDAQLDEAPVSRLVFAREAARRALRELPCGSRIGWAAFTEYRTLLLLAPIEVCENYDDLLATLAGIDGRIRWGNASEVAKGVFWAVRAAKELPSHPAIVFLTDGQEAPPLNAFPMFDDVQPGQVHGWLLGVGGSVPRPIPRTDADGHRIGWWRATDVLQRAEGDGPSRSHEHLSELREPHLRALAQRTGLGYASLRDPAALPSLLRDPALARPTEVPTDLRALPAALALLLLALHFRPGALRRERARLSRISGT